MNFNNRGLSTDTLVYNNFAHVVKLFIRFSLPVTHWMLNLLFIHSEFCSIVPHLLYLGMGPTKKKENVSFGDLGYYDNEMANRMVKIPMP